MYGKILKTKLLICREEPTEYPMRTNIRPLFLSRGYENIKPKAIE
jgi:hypothetical protein